MRRVKSGGAVEGVGEDKCLVACMVVRISLLGTKTGRR